MRVGMRVGMRVCVIMGCNDQHTQLRDHSACKPQNTATHLAITMRDQEDRKREENID